MRLKTANRHQPMASILPTLFWVSAGLLVTACSTLPVRFSSADQALLEEAMQLDASASVDRLDRGRALLLGRCGRCHRVEPIGKYTFGQWQAILPDMSEEAKLSTSQAEDVSLYVLALRRTLAASRPVEP